MSGWKGAKLALVVLLVTPVLVGCIGLDDDPLEPTSARERVLAPGEGIDEALLTQPVHDVLDPVVERVEMSLDGIQLYAEVHLPEGEGPWPTILELSPYNVIRLNGAHNVPGVEMPTALTEYYVPRGYAVVLAHVRGTGNSEGCMDMMGAKEQQDAHDVVEWVAAQPWSDGKVGMHGFSYVGTTPNQAAIMAPEHLVTIVAGAGVTNQWRNTFMNGVPYDGRHYPLTYNAFSAAPPTDVQRGPAWGLNAADAACDQEEAIAAMSPGTYEKGVYTDYWAERNLTRGAADVNASVLYLQGFADRAVNPSEAVHWFNELDVPKKALFHQAGHTWPPREDYKVIEHAWLDHWLKGIENGVMDTPTVEVLTNVDTVRMGDTWPPVDAQPARFYLSEGGLEQAPPAPGEQAYVADQARNAVTATASPGPVDTAEAAADQALASAGVPTELTWTSDPLDQDVHLAGQARLHLVASVDAENTYFLFDLYDVDGDEATWLAEGWFNAHLREGFDRSAPLTPGQATTFSFPFEAREWVVEAGHQLRLVVHGHDDRVFPVDQPVTTNTIHLGAEGSWLELPVLTEPLVFDRPSDV